MHAYENICIAMQARRLATALPLVSALLWAASAAADSGEVTVAVLGIETIDVPAAVGDEIAEQLRHRVAAAKDLRLVAGKDLVEIKLVFSCADESHSCMAQAGKSLGADKLIYGSVKQQGHDHAVWLKMFDVRREAVESWVTDTVPKRPNESPVIKAAAARWFAKLTGRPVSTGTVQVTANVYGASVSIDGRSVGTTGEHPLVVPDLAAGRHEVVIEKTGYEPARQQFLLGAGQVAPVSLNLHPLRASMPHGPPTTTVTPAAVEPATPALAAPAYDDDAVDDDGRGGSRTGFWITLAAAVVSGGAAVKYGLDVRETNDQLTPFRRFNCTDGGRCTDANGNAAAPITEAQRQEAERIASDGESAQRMQWIFIGVGSAFAAASGYFLYRGYLDSDAPGQRREARRGVRIFPTASASTGGILAELDF